jgi:hypothetical protein
MTLAKGDQPQVHVHVAPGWREHERKWTLGRRSVPDRHVDLEQASEPRAVLVLLGARREMPQLKAAVPSMARSRSAATRPRDPFRSRSTSSRHTAWLIRTAIRARPDVGKG